MPKLEGAIEAHAPDKNQSRLLGRRSPTFNPLAGPASGINRTHSLIGGPGLKMNLTAVNGFPVLQHLSGDGVIE